MSFAYEADLVCQAFVADTDLSDKQYCAVYMTDTETIALASDSSAEYMLGVLQDKPDEAGKTCVVALDGISKAKGGAPIDAGKVVVFTTGGKFIELTSGRSA